jgi:O-antigen/teichoic acid export membrane protein
VLISGTVVAHGITALVLPILSRLYSPVEFSSLALFSALVSIIAAAACLRFDVAVAVPENNNDAVNVLVLALVTSCAVAIVLFAITFFASSQIISVLNQPSLSEYLWLAPISVFLASAVSALQMWFVRTKQFALVSKSRIAQSAVAAGVQTSTGAVGLGTIGLLTGYVLNFGAAFFILGCRFLENRENRASIRNISLPSLKKAFKDHDRFPKYSALEALSNAASIQLPIVLIAIVALPKEAGYLTLATYVIQAPMALVGVAVGQVYLSQASEKHREGRLHDFTCEVLRGLIKGGAPPLLAIGIVAPFTFGVIFGSDWDRAGSLVAWMTPWFILQFLVSPISMALHVTNNQKTALLLQLFGLAFRLGVVWISSRIALNSVSEAYAISGFVFYSIYLFLVLHTIKIGLDK